MSLGSRVRNKLVEITDSKRFRDVREWALTGMDLSFRLMHTWPNSSDSVLQKTFKIAGSVREVNNVLFMADIPSVRRYVERNKLQTHDSSMFVSIFFNSLLHHEFQIERLSCKDGSLQTLILAKGKLGVLAFTQYHTQRTYGERFYCEAGLSPEGLIDRMWALYDGRIHLSLPPVGSDAELECTQVQEVTTPLYGEAKARMEFLRKRHKRCVAAGEARTYMLYGPPGTGKSSFATDFASSEGHKILRFNAQSLKYITVHSLTYLLEHLVPEFVIIEDMDKIEMGTTLPDLLEVLQSVKMRGGTNFLMTANKIDMFDKGLLRPRRIDTWIEFELPDELERLDVLTQYAKDFVLDTSPTDLARLAKQSDGLSHDYLREILVELRQSESLEETLKVVHRMRKIQDLEDLEPEVKPQSNGAMHVNGVGHPSTINTTS